MKENDSKWASAGHVQHEAILIGEIKSIIEEKQRFYYHRYIHVQSLRLQTETKLITVQKITPITKGFQKVSFKVGDTIKVYGMWKDNKFVFNEYVIEKR